VRRPGQLASCKLLTHALGPRVGTDDWQDSLLMQLSGTKKFTIIDPARLHTAYPCVQKMMQL
jgi:hypothetical protein